MSKLSLVIIAFNEEENIGKCIESVRGLADEILVVDSFSTDKTPQIVLAKGARLVQHKFEGHIQQKNWAKEQAVNDYVLSLDADESLSEELKISLNKLKVEGFSADGYTMNRLNFYCGKPIKTCGWYPDKKLRLWKRTKGVWRGHNPHDKFELPPGSEIRQLNGDILHNTYPTRQSLLNQVEKFATISAQHLKNRNILYLVIKMLFSPSFKFIRNYFFKLGISEGTVGITICTQQAREVFLKYFRAIKFKFS